jgi:hypothetical protein
MVRLRPRERAAVPRPLSETQRMPVGRDIRKYQGSVSLGPHANTLVVIT